jgi:hypothetical protein
MIYPPASPPHPDPHHGPPDVAMQYFLIALPVPKDFETDAARA